MFTLFTPRSETSVISGWLPLAESACAVAEVATNNGAAATSSSRISPCRPGAELASEVVSPPRQMHAAGVLAASYSCSGTQFLFDEAGGVVRIDFPGRHAVLKAGMVIPFTF